MKVWSLVAVALILAGCNGATTPTADTVSDASNSTSNVPDSSAAKFVGAVLFVNEPFFEHTTYNATFALPDADGRTTALAGVAKERWIDNTGTVLLTREWTVSASDYVPKPTSDVLVAGDISIRGPVLRWSHALTDFSFASPRATNATVVVDFRAASGIVTARSTVYDIRPLADPAPSRIHATARDWFGNYTAQVWVENEAGKAIAADILLKFVWTDEKGLTLLSQERLFSRSDFQARPQDDPSISMIWTVAQFNKSRAGWGTDVTLNVSGLSASGRVLLPGQSTTRFDDGLAAASEPVVRKLNLTILSISCENVNGSCSRWNASLAFRNDGNQAEDIIQFDIVGRFPAVGEQRPTRPEPRPITIRPGETATVVVAFPNWGRLASIAYVDGNDELASADVPS